MAENHSGEGQGLHQEVVAIESCLQTVFDLFDKPPVVQRQRAIATPCFCRKHYIEAGSQSMCAD